MPKRKPLDETWVRRQSTRQVRKPQKFDATPVKKESKYWSLAQKQCLLKTLTQISKQNQQPRHLNPMHLKMIQKSVKTKSIDNIKAYIEKLILSISKDKDPDNEHRDTPLKQWVELFEDQAEAIDHDCSSDISKVLSTASRENHGNPMIGPDFKRLYQFMDSLFQGKTLPELSNIDSLVILDCIQNLEHFLDGVDTTRQKDFIVEKSKKLKEFLYSKDNYIVTTEMCDEFTIEENESQKDIGSQRKKKSKQIICSNEPIASCSGTNASSDKNITLSMSSINPFGVPADVLNLTTDAITV